MSLRLAEVLNAEVVKKIKTKADLLDDREDDFKDKQEYILTYLIWKAIEYLYPDEFYFPDFETSRTDFMSYVLKWIRPRIIEIYHRYARYVKRTARFLAKIPNRPSRKGCCACPWFICCGSSFNEEKEFNLRQLVDEALKTKGRSATFRISVFDSETIHTDNEISLKSSKDAVTPTLDRIDETSSIKVDDKCDKKIEEKKANEKTV